MLLVFFFSILLLLLHHPPKPSYLTPSIIIPNYPPPHGTAYVPPHINGWRNGWMDGWLDGIVTIQPQKTTNQT